MRLTPALAIFTLLCTLMYVRQSFIAVGVAGGSRPEEAELPQRLAAPLLVGTQKSDAVTAEAITLPPPHAINPPPPPPSPLPSTSPPSATPVGARHARGRRISITVGLNKGVYKKEKERRYSCPALRGGTCLFTTERSRFPEAHALLDVLKDARRAGPLDFRVKKGQYKGVIISEKDEAKHTSAAFRANAYDFEVGYNKKSATIWRPFMCNEVSRKTNLTIAEVLLRGARRLRSRPPFEQGLNGAVWPPQVGELAAFVSNCVGWRLEYMRELRKYVTLDSYGACAHNNDTCAKSGKRKCDKVVRAGAYKFVFAFENSEESHYVTEKVYTGLRSGAIPIYKGAPEILQHVPGAHSIILADSFSGPAELGKHLQSLLKDERAYEAHHQWDLKAFAASEAMAQCPWQCRLCEWLAAKQQQ